MSETINETYNRLIRITDEPWKLNRTERAVTEIALIFYENILNLQAENERLKKELSSERSVNTNGCGECHYNDENVLLEAENERLRGELAALKAEGRGEDYMRIEWLSHENDGLKAQFAALKKRIEDAICVTATEVGGETLFELGSLMGPYKIYVPSNILNLKPHESCKVRLVRECEG